VAPSTAHRRPNKPVSTRPRKQSRARAKHHRSRFPIFSWPAHDVWGMVLLLAAGLAGLGIYGDLTGPAGRWFSRWSGDAVGLGRFALPVALAVVGVGLVRARPGWGSRCARSAGGSFLVLCGLCGLCQLGKGPKQLKHLTDHLGAVRAAGGLLGVAVGVPLRSSLALWGAGFILVALVLVGVLVITSTTVREASQWVEVAGSRLMEALVDSLRVAREVIEDHDRRRHERAAQRAAQRAIDDGTGPQRPELSGFAGSTGAPDPGPGGQGPGVFDFDDIVVRDEPDVADGDVPGVPGAPVPAAAGGPRRSRSRPTIETHTPANGGIQMALDVEPLQRGGWQLPSLALLKRDKVAEIDRGLIESLGRTLEAALATHGVETRLVGMIVGPTVTRYELELGPAVKVSRVVSLQRDIAYAMAAEDVRILAPIPGRSAVGVEVPNRQRQNVTLGDILVSQEAQQAVHPLSIGVGRDIAGRPVMANLADMPHLIIAGATGAGKSSCINSMITSILLRTTPDQVRMILIDPKRVELSQYRGLPHLLTQVVVDPKKAANALAWAVTEMEQRYDLLAEVGVRDITGYNEAFDRGELGPEVHAISGEVVKTFERLPYILVIVDELNDLMMTAARDVEDSICRIAQKARAVGVHLVIATQRPSVDVITGVIKANVPSKLAFAVSSQTDSRVILDQVGAERLVGRGDALLLTASSSTAVRIQGAWVGEDEVRTVVAHWRRQAEPHYIPGVEGETARIGSAGGDGGADGDDMLEAALELVVSSQLGSTSMLQRKLRVGFARAGRLMDLLEQRGVVGPSEGSKARAVLMSVEELQARSDAG
jgi:S-DNA-T family DNA segregation ATPase FtsK/SpoIIIE